MDLIGFIIPVSLVLYYRPSLATCVLPFTIAGQYVVSFMHHWLPYNEWRSKLDRTLISLVIAATYVPYWGNLLPPPDSFHRLIWVGFGAVIAVAFVLCNIRESLVGAFWAIFAGAGLVISFWELQVWLPRAALIVFWIGSSLYAVQQIVFTFEYFDWRPGLFGYREIQHLFLVPATTIGSLVAIYYT